MNAWRWFGLSIFLIATVCLLGNTDFSAFANGKDKTPTKTDKTDK
jgi:hypothetical protein